MTSFDSQSKVAQFCIVITCQKYISWFDVTVKYFVTLA